MLRVAIIDDEYYFRISLIRNMPWAENGMELVGDANDGFSGEALLLSLRPDVALVDINMPGLSGLQLIERVRNAGLRNCRFVILTGYDDFKFAQQAISLGVSDYVLKPVDYGALMRTLNQLHSDIQRQRDDRSRLTHLERANLNFQRDKLFTELVDFRRIIDEDEQRELLGERYEHFAVALLAQRSAVTYEEACAMREALGSVRFSFAYAAFVDAKNRLAILADVASAEQFAHLLDLLGGILSPFAPLDMGAGRVVAAFDQIFLSYSEALIALRNHVIFRGGAPLPRMGINTQSLAEAKTRLRRGLLNAEGDRIEQTLEEIYAHLHNGKAPYDLIVLNTLELTALLCSTLDQQGVNASGLLSSELSLMEQMEQQSTVSEFCRWIAQRFALGAEMLQRSRQAHSDTTQRMLQYVHQNLGNSELSVAQIAKNLFVNYSHLCYVFKRDMGITVNEYITFQRIEHAKDLFHGGSNNVAYVARRVGYDDANYFSKSFKKKEGVSPSEFIRQLGRG